MLTKVMNKSRLFIFALILLILVIIGTSMSLTRRNVQAGPYSTQMIAEYAGMVKPQLNLNDYDGSTGNHYSTAYNGKYLATKTPNPQGTIAPGLIYYDEGSGDHPAVDIQLGDCVTTPIRAIAEGKIVDIKIWTAGNECGENSNG